MFLKTVENAEKTEGGGLMVTETGEFVVARPNEYFYSSESSPLTLQTSMEPGAKQSQELSGIRRHLRDSKCAA
jgi:hypothetical protein